MEYIDILNRIIETEKRAQEIAGNAKKQETHLNETLNSELDILHEKYLARAQNRLALVKSQEEQYTAEQLAALKESFQQDLYALEDTFLSHSQEWLERLLASVTGADKS